MASSLFNKFVDITTMNNTIKAVTTYSAAQTGITGVTAYKNGIHVELHVESGPFNPSASGWQTLGTLPTALRPKAAQNVLFYDNYTGDQSKTVMSAQILTTGVVRWYAYGAGTNIYPRGTISYISAS